MSDDWRNYTRRIEDLAAASGLKFHPVDFEAVPDSFMMEIAVYGLPVRMPHWSFGVRYIYQLIQRHMGHSRLFEVVFPGNPGHAYLAASNGLAENILVTAHVLGHADFSRNNLLFRRCQEQVSERIVDDASPQVADAEHRGFEVVDEAAHLGEEHHQDRHAQAARPGGGALAGRAEPGAGNALVPGRDRARPSPGAPGHRALPGVFGSGQW